MGTWVIAGGCEEWGWVGCTLEGWQDRSWQMKVNTAVLAVNKTNAPFLADLCWIAKHFMIKQIPMIWNLNTQLVCYSDPHWIMCTRKTDVITSLISEISHSLHNCSHFNAFLIQIYFQILGNIKFNDEMKKEHFYKYHRKPETFHAFCRGLPGKLNSLCTVGIWILHPGSRYPYNRSWTWNISRFETKLTIKIGAQVAEGSKASFSRSYLGLEV